MKRMVAGVKAALVVAMALMAFAGCSGNAASSASTQASGASSASASSASSSAQSTSELAAELKAAIANAPAFKSVTVTVESGAVFVSKTAEESASSASSAEDPQSESLEGTTVYKFDASGDVIKTSAVAQFADTEFKSFTEGENAVFVADGSAYAGTAEQYNMTHAKGFEAFLLSTIGDLPTLVDCAAEIEKTQANGYTFYLVKLDPESYIASDEALKFMANEGDSVKEALLAVSFNEDGSFASIDLGINYEKDHAVSNHLVFSDYDNTVVDPMPAADKTFEDWRAEITAELEPAK